MDSRKKILSTSKLPFVPILLEPAQKSNAIAREGNQQGFGGNCFIDTMEVENGDATSATNGDNRELTKEEKAVDEEKGVTAKSKDESEESEDKENDSEDKNEKNEPTETEKTKSNKKGSSKRSDKKPNSSTSLKKKNKQKKDTKKSKKKEKDKKKTKGESKRNLIDKDETGNATTTETEKSGANNDDGSRTQSKASSTTYDDTVNRISMKSLRKMEKARQSREGPKSFDAEDDGLWVGTTEESQTRSYGYEKLKTETRSSTKDDKADWQASVTADDSSHPNDNDADDSDTDYRDYSNRSSRSHRASGKSYRSSGGSSIRNSGYGFRSLIEDRNSSLYRSIIGEDVNSDSDKSEPKRKSQTELRQDLEAQARERLEKSSREHEKGAVMAAFKKFTEKSRKRMSAIFETPGIQDGDIRSDVENEKEDDSTKKRGNKDGEKDKEVGKKKLTMREQWRALKRNARSRKGYTVIVSVLLSIAVIVAITLTALLAS